MNKLVTGFDSKHHASHVDWKYVPDTDDSFVSRRAFLLNKQSGENLILIIGESVLRFISSKIADFYWRCELPPKTRIIPNIYFFEDILIIASFDNTLFAFDVAHRKCLWSQKLQSAIFFPPEGFEDVCVVSLAQACGESGKLSLDASVPSQLIALDIHTGDVLWHRYDDYSGPAYINLDTLVVSLTDNNILCLDIKTGDTLWKSDMYSELDSYWCSFYDNEIFLLGSYTFRALEQETGAIVWSCTSPAEPTTCVTFDRDRMYFVSRDDCAQALDLNTGRLLWKYKLSFPKYGGMHVNIFGENVMFAKENVFYIFSAATGKLKLNKIFAVYTQGTIFPEYLVYSHYCFFTDGIGELSMIDLKTMKVAWKVQLRRFFTSRVVSMLTDGNYVYVVDEIGVTVSVNLHSVLNSVGA